MDRSNLIARLEAEARVWAPSPLTRLLIDAITALRGAEGAPLVCRVCGGSGFVAQKQSIDDGYGEADSCPACDGFPREGPMPRLGIEGYDDSGDSDTTPEPPAPARCHCGPDMCSCGVTKARLARRKQRIEARGERPTRERE
jgi:hypothetical protein